MPKSAMKTHEEVLKEIYSLVGSEYEILEEYKGTCVKIKFRHNACGSEFYMSPSNFKRGSRCRKCSYKRVAKEQTKAQEKFTNEFKQIVGNEYELLSEYVNRASEIKIKHNLCGNVYSVRANNFLNGSRCPKCFRNYKKTTKQFKQEVYDLVGDEYKILGEYIGALKKIKITHTKCGHVYDVKPSNFLVGKRCPKCRESKGEREIKEFLSKNKLAFKRQYKIDECKNTRSLPFDFAVFSKRKLLCLIEYDGRQHYTPVEVFGGVNDFNKTKLRDNIKTNYCKINKIPLIRIPYSTKDISSYLEIQLGKIIKFIQLEVI